MVGSAACRPSLPSLPQVPRKGAALKQRRDRQRQNTNVAETVNAVQSAEATFAGGVGEFAGAAAASKAPSPETVPAHKKAGLSNSAAKMPIVALIAESAGSEISASNLASCLGLNPDYVRKAVSLPEVQARNGARQTTLLDSKHFSTTRVGSLRTHALMQDIFLTRTPASSVAEKRASCSYHALLCCSVSSLLCRTCFAARLLSTQS